ncbi:hypothetical protein T4B_3797 [Trichinella pseudospiralis]|uniref:Uncharacterized protein n=1 Tax=Trichinella pseudospiralis TaxID=6337 RepID=A0A0V1ITA8_TRIPS|nr:hypothetical protein T4A_1253 [Trichinella pseudospiralis]KRZ26020.1 hypothetical protein T4B_3797 [Trichinella pseudospiralis]
MVDNFENSWSLAFAAFKASKCNTLPILADRNALAFYGRLRIYFGSNILASALLKTLQSTSV